MTEVDPKYQPIAPDPAKSCKNCKHFEAEAEEFEVGKCFGNEVSAKGTCNYFEPKK